MAVSGRNPCHIPAGPVNPSRASFLLHFAPYFFSEVYRKELGKDHAAKTFSLSAISDRRVLHNNLRAKKPSARPQMRLTRRKNRGVTKRRPQAIRPAIKKHHSNALQRKPARNTTRSCGSGKAFPLVAITVLPMPSQNASGSGFAREIAAPRAKSPRTLDDFASSPFPR